MTSMITAWSGELLKYKIKCAETSCAVDGWATPAVHQTYAILLKV